MKHLFGAMSAQSPEPNTAIYIEVNDWMMDNLL